MSATESFRLNVTWHGVCPACGIGMTMSGYRADDTPEARAKLGSVAEQQVTCVVCEEAVVPLLCVGICLDPFAPQRLEDEDEDDYFEEEAE